MHVSANLGVDELALGPALDADLEQKVVLKGEGEAGAAAAARGLAGRDCRGARSLGGRDLC